jgi:MFS superfamily sulfate permease-like transporter
VVILGIVASPLLGLDQYGVKLLGTVPHGLPSPGLPAIELSDINELLPLAVACFLLGAVETAAIGRMFTMKHGGRLDPNREFLALAAANLAAGLGRGFPVSGGMSQSVVNEGGGARTPLSGFFASLILLAVVLWFSGLLRNLPQPVLAAVVLVAVGGLLQPRTLLHLWKADCPEFAAAMGTLVGVLGSGLLRGVMFGALISLVQLIRRAARPHVAVLGRIPGTSRFSDMQRHPENEPVRGGLLVRPESGLIYFNIGHVCDTIMERARESDVKFVVIDLSSAPYIDLQSAEALATLADELKRQGTAIHAVEARAVVRDRLRLAGVDEKLGGLNRAYAMADVVDRYEGQTIGKAEGPAGNT